MTEKSAPIRIFVDADACPVKDEVYRVAARHALAVTVVAQGFIRVPDDPLIERVAAGQAPDAADDWIMQHADKHSIVVTSDIPLASRAVKAGCHRDCAGRPRLHRRGHRHGARHAQPDDRPPLGGWRDQRPTAILETRPLGISVRARYRHPPPAALVWWFRSPLDRRGEFVRGLLNLNHTRNHNCQCPLESEFVTVVLRDQTTSIRTRLIRNPPFLWALSRRDRARGDSHENGNARSGPFGVRVFQRGRRPRPAAATSPPGVPPSSRKPPARAFRPVRSARSTA